MGTNLVWHNGCGGGYNPGALDRRRTSQDFRSIVDCLQEPTTNRKEVYCDN